jgi:class 3 adenylate cyclase
MQCPRCQVENDAGARVCEDCGARGTALTPEPSRFIYLESYTPKHLAEKILTSKSALDGERKQVTVFFADVKDSMVLLADRDPEVSRKILEPVLERVVETVHRFEEAVSQMMGDGIVVLSSGLQGPSNSTRAKPPSAPSAGIYEASRLRPLPSRGRHGQIASQEACRPGHRLALRRRAARN